MHAAEKYEEKQILVNGQETMKVSGIKGVITLKKASKLFKASIQKETRKKQKKGKKGKKQFKRQENISKKVVDKDIIKNGLSMNFTQKLDDSPPQSVQLANQFVFSRVFKQIGEERNTQIAHNNTVDYLSKIIEWETDKERLQQCTEYYRNKYKFTWEFNEELILFEEWNDFTPLQIAHQIKLLEIPKTKPELFWLARLYLSLPLPPKYYKYFDKNIEREIYINLDTRMKFVVRPCYLYIQELINIGKSMLSDCDDSENVPRLSPMEFKDKLGRKNTVNMIAMLNFFDADLKYYDRAIRERMTSLSSIEDFKPFNYDKNKKEAYGDLDFNWIKRKPNLLDEAVIEICHQAGIDLDVNLHEIGLLLRFMLEKENQTDWVFRKHDNGEFFWINHKAKKTSPEYPHLKELMLYFEENAIEFDSKAILSSDSTTVKALKWFFSIQESKQLDEILEPRNYYMNKLIIKNIIKKKKERSHDPVIKDFKRRMTQTNATPNVDFKKLLAGLVEEKEKPIAPAKKSQAEIYDRMGFLIPVDIREFVAACKLRVSKSKLIDLLFFCFFDLQKNLSQEEKRILNINQMGLIQDRFIEDRKQKKDLNDELMDSQDPTEIATVEKQFERMTYFLDIINRRTTVSIQEDVLNLDGLSDMDSIAGDPLTLGVDFVSRYRNGDSFSQTSFSNIAHRIAKQKIDLIGKLEGELEDIDDISATSPFLTQNRRSTLKRGASISNGLGLETKGKKSFVHSHSTLGIPSEKKNTLKNKLSLLTNNASMIDLIKKRDISDIQDSAPTNSRDLQDSLTNNIGSKARRIPLESKTPSEIPSRVRNVNPGIRGDSDKEINTDISDNSSQISSFLLLDKNDKVGVKTDESLEEDLFNFASEAPKLGNYNQTSGGNKSKTNFSLKRNGTPQITFEQHERLLKKQEMMQQAGRKIKENHGMMLVEEHVYVPGEKLQKNFNMIDLNNQLNAILPTAQEKIKQEAAEQVIINLMKNIGGKLIEDQKKAIKAAVNEEYDIEIFRKQRELELLSKRIRIRTNIVSKLNLKQDLIKEEKKELYRSKKLILKLLKENKSVAEIIAALKAGFNTFDRWFIQYLLIATKERKIFKKEREFKIPEIKTIDLIKFLHLPVPPPENIDDKVFFIWDGDAIRDHERKREKMNPTQVLQTEIMTGSTTERSLYYLKKLLNFVISKLLASYQISKLKGKGSRKQASDLMVQISPQKILQSNKKLISYLTRSIIEKMGSSLFMSPEKFHQNQKKILKKIKRSIERELDSICEGEFPDLQSVKRMDTSSIMIGNPVQDPNTIKIGRKPQDQKKKSISIFPRLLKIPPRENDQFDDRRIFAKKYECVFKVNKVS